METLPTASDAMKRHNQLTEHVKSERKITHEVLKDILAMDTLKDYAELGYPSMYEYLVRGQKYSEGSAQRRLSAARLLKENPEIQSRLQEGHLNLTQLVKLSIACKHEQKSTGEKITSLEKKELLKKLENKNGLETEKLLSEELNYQPKMREKVTPQAQDYFLTLKLAQNQYEKLKKAQALLSHVHPEGGFAEVIEALCDKLIQSKEGVSNRVSLSAAPCQNSPAIADARVDVAKNATRRVYVPTATQKYVFHKARNCCEYVSSMTGIRCNSRYQLQIDHVLPLAKGGGSNPENLRILCRTHNLAEARRWGLDIALRSMD